MDKYIYNRVEKHYHYLESLGYNVVAVFAQGSMNYGLYVNDDEYKSDVDTKAIVLPTLDDLVNGKWYPRNMILKENKLMLKILGL